MELEGGIRLSGGSIQKLSVPVTEPALNGELGFSQGKFAVRRGNENLPLPPAIIYEFSSHVFAAGHSEGRTASLPSVFEALYSNLIWTTDISLFRVENGVQIWTVPKTGMYRIETAGAKGGGDRGGAGAIIRGDFWLSKGDTVRILVGKRGAVTSQNSDFGAGGGGGSYVFFDASDVQPLIVAGGGGGHAERSAGGPGSATEEPTNSIGGGSGPKATAGHGGNSGANIGRYSTGSGGGGWLTDGKRGHHIRNPPGDPGSAPRNGAAGGVEHHPNYGRGYGGFGGGAAFTDNSGAGGGGGYSGGIGGTLGQSGRLNGVVPTGGGSFNAGEVQSNSAGANSGEGYISVVRL